RAIPTMAKVATTGTAMPAIGTCLRTIAGIFSLLDRRAAGPRFGGERMPDTGVQNFERCLVYPCGECFFSLRSARLGRPGGVRVIFRFGDHALDIERRELRRGAELIALEPKVFDLLIYLVRNRGRVVSKDDLIQGVWGGRIVSDSALTTRSMQPAGLSTTAGRYSVSFAPCSAKAGALSVT